MHVCERVVVVMVVCVCVCGGGQGGAGGSCCLHTMCTLP